MLLPRVPMAAPASELPQWPPLLATRGAGARSELHSHHAMHFLIALTGTLELCGARGAPVRAAGVLTPPDVPHGVDARGVDVLLVFLDPESDAGASLAAALAGSLRPLTDAERDDLLRGAEPRSFFETGGTEWLARALRALGGAELPTARPVHPRVRRLLRVLKAGLAQNTSLEGLAEQLGMSPSRLMHVFTESVGIPLRPYLGWLRLQRAAFAISTGLPLAEAAHAAGFADAAHMSRTFRRMLGTSPSALRPARPTSAAHASGASRPVRSRKPPHWAPD